MRDYLSKLATLIDDYYQSLIQQQMPVILRDLIPIFGRPNTGQCN